MGGERGKARSVKKTQPYSSVSQIRNCRSESESNLLMLKTLCAVSASIVFIGAIETSRNIAARVIERDTSGEIYYFLEDSRGFRTRQNGRQ
ncbi:hypothetical protein TNCV_3238421 [Trichonephila clavipes]|nr:hypothetical protein TNCV_3238421 [Trichonephila clavipes]